MEFCSYYLRLRQDPIMPACLYFRGRIAPSKSLLSIFWPPHGSLSQIEYTKVEASKIKQSPNYSPNFYTKIVISLQSVAMSSFVACVTNEVPSIRWSLLAVS